MRAIYVEKNLPRMLAVKLLRGLWPGVVWSPLSPAHIVEVAEPPLPGDRWVRVRTEQCGICASDLSLLQVKVDPSIAPSARTRPAGVDRRGRHHWAAELAGGQGG